MGPNTIQDEGIQRRGARPRGGLLLIRFGKSLSYLYLIDRTNNSPAIFCLLREENNSLQGTKCTGNLPMGGGLVVGHGW